MQRLLQNGAAGRYCKREEQGHGDIHHQALSLTCIDSVKQMSTLTCSWYCPLVAPSASTTSLICINVSHLPVQPPLDRLICLNVTHLLVELPPDRLVRLNVIR
mmetsp:Transcript_10031/g.27332  ORF Transcript_10031/g.27332 Transcript_10031/m.27332 type:complete len:103 (-) Transcript_10031:5420-5728(-)